MAKKEETANDNVPTIELNIKDLPDLPKSVTKMTAAEIAARTEKGGKKNVRRGNVEVELADNATIADVAASVKIAEAISGEGDGKKKRKAKTPKAPKEPKPPAMPKERRYGKFPTAFIKSMDISALKAEVALMPEAERRRIFYERQRPDGTLELVPALDNKGVEMYCGVDMGGLIVNVPSNEYEIVQYSEAFSPVLEFLAEHHETSKICAGLTHNCVDAHMYVAFPDKFNYVDPTGSKFELGMVVSTSHKNQAVRFDGFGYRASCMNAYVLSKNLGTMSIVHRSNAHEKIANYINQLEFGIDALDEHMKIARAIELPASEVAAWVRENYIERMVGPIMTRYTEDKELNALGLYNAITNVLSRAGEQSLIEADGLMENLKFAEMFVTIDDGYQDNVRADFSDALTRFNREMAVVA